MLNLWHLRQKALGEAEEDEDKDLLSQAISLSAENNEEELLRKAIALSLQDWKLSVIFVAE